MSDLALPIPLLIRVKHYMAANRSIRRITSVGHKQFSFPDCWFASDITATLLVIKNKSISLLWELNSTFREILQKTVCCIDHKHGRLLTWLQTKNIEPLPQNKLFKSSHSTLRPSLQQSNNYLSMSFIDSRVVNLV